MLGLVGIKIRFYRPRMLTFREASLAAWKWKSGFESSRTPGMGLGLGALFQLPGVSRSWLGSDGVAWERHRQGTDGPALGL